MRGERAAVASPRPSGERRFRQRGFSLLEVVVALAILGLLLVTLADSVRGGLLGGAKAASVEMLLAEAESRLALVGTAELPLEPGTRQGSDGDLRWRLDVEEIRDPAPDFDDAGAPGAYRVRMTVTAAPGGVPRSLALDTVRLRPGTEP
jgi:general secretion pathway protein I